MGLGKKIEYGQKVINKEGTVYTITGINGIKESTGNFESVFLSLGDSITNDFICKLEDLEKNYTIYYNWTEYKCPVCGCDLYEDDRDYILQEHSDTSQQDNPIFYLMSRHVTAHICSNCGYVALHKNY